MQKKVFTLIILFASISCNANATDYYLAGSASGNGTGIGGWGNAAAAQTYFNSLLGTSLAAGTHIYIQTTFVIAGSFNVPINPIYLNNNDILIQGGFPSSATGTDLSGYNPVTNQVSISVPDNSVLFKSNGSGNASNIIEIKGIRYFTSGLSNTFFGGGFSDGGNYRFTDIQMSSVFSNNGIFQLDGFTQGGSATFKNCEFDNCIAQKGGASVINGGSSIPITIINCSFSINKTFPASGTISYGAISSSYPGTISITNSFFCDNSNGSASPFTTGGGAITCFGSSNYTTLYVSGCVFSNNFTTVGGGGAIFCNQGTLHISNSSFLWNNTSSAVTGGGAILLGHSSGGNTINNCKFYRNSAVGNRTVGNGSSDGPGGGAINIGYDNRDFTISNSEFVNNYVSSGSVGGAIILYNDQGTNATISNCLFNGNFNNGATASSDVIAHGVGSNSGLLIMDTDTLQLATQSSYTDYSATSTAGYSFIGTNLFNNIIDHVGTPSPYKCPTFATTIVLPITITSFAATKTNNGNLLAWTADNAVNFSHFNVQRQEEGGNFATIGKVDLNIGYNFTDVSPLKKINYYRLEMVDKDGSIQYSKIVAVANTTPATVFLYIYPTPATSNLFVEFQSSAAGIIHYYITDLSGKIIKKIIQPTILGTNKQVLDIADLPIGLYIAKTQSSDGGTYNFKIIKQ